MFRHVVVPLDGSDFSRAALPYALELPGGPDPTLEMVSAIDSRAALSGVGYADNITNSAPALGAYAGLPGGAVEFMERVRGTRQEELDATAESLRSQERVTIRSTLLDGEPSEAVASHVDASGADLVVMSTHGRGGMARAWLGSVADRLVRHVTVPVLLVRPTEDRTEAAQGSRPAIRRVLVPLDGSELAEAALGPAARVARQTGGALTLARVVGTDVLLEPSYPPVPEGAVEEQVGGRTREARQYLEEIADRLRADGVDVADVVVSEGSPATAIVDIAREKADAIAMATHGRGGLRRWVLGSVSDKVLRSGDLPVLLIRPGESDEGDAT